MYILDFRSTRCIDTTAIRHLDRLNVIGLAETAISTQTQPIDKRSRSTDCPACFWSTLRSLRILHVSLRPSIRQCFADLLGLEELYLVAHETSTASVASSDDHQQQYPIHFTTGTVGGEPAAASTVSNEFPLPRQRLQSERLLHIDSSVMPQLNDCTKLRLLDLRGMAIGSLAADAFASLANVHRLTVRLHGTAIVTLPSGLFYTLHSVSNLAVELSGNRHLSGLSPNVFYPNVSVWDAVGTRSIVGGLDVRANAALGCDCGLVWLGHWLRRWLRETTQMNVVTREEGIAMIEVL